MNSHCPTLNQWNMKVFHGLYTYRKKRETVFAVFLYRTVKIPHVVGGLLKSSTVLWVRKSLYFAPGGLYLALHLCLGVIMSHISWIKSVMWSPCSLSCHLVTPRCIICARRTIFKEDFGHIVISWHGWKQTCVHVEDTWHNDASCTEPFIYIYFSPCTIQKHGNQ